MIITIDPSVNFTGIAVHSGKRFLWVGLVRMDKIKDMFEKLEHLYDAVYAMIDQYPVPEELILIIETPNYQFVDKNKKSMMKLWKWIGMMEGRFVNTCDSVIEVPVREWKGNKPKEETEVIVKKKYKTAYKEALKTAKSYRHNIIDAIGIAGWYVNGGYKHEVE